MFGVAGVGSAMFFVLVVHAIRLARVSQGMADFFLFDYYYVLSFSPGLPFPHFVVLFVVSFLFGVAFVGLALFCFCFVIDAICLVRFPEALQVSSFIALISRVEFLPCLSFTMVRCFVVVVSFCLVWLLLGWLCLVSVIYAMCLVRVFRGTVVSSFFPFHDYVLSFSPVCRLPFLLFCLCVVVFLPGAACAGLALFCCVRHAFGSGFPRHCIFFHFYIIITMCRFILFIVYFLFCLCCCCSVSFGVARVGLALFLFLSLMPCVWFGVSEALR